MTRIYIDLETYRPDEGGAFIDEKIIAAGLIVDKTAYHSDNLKQNIPPMIFAEWKGHNEKKIVELVLEQVNKSLGESRFTDVCGYNILRFDIPMLICKSVELLDIEPRKAARQWWDPLSSDLQQQVLTINNGRFKGTGLGNVVKVAKRNGMNPPEYTESGASIRELYPADKFDEIDHHLIQDLKIIRWLHLAGLRELAWKGIGKRNFFD
jgi:hypothetical protein